VNISGRGIVPLPDLFTDSHKEVRGGVSDHAPIWLALGDASMSINAYEGALINVGSNQAPASTLQSTSGIDCIDLNSASPEALEALPNVGEVRAQSIIDLRPWGGPGELARVSGLGPASVRDIVATGLVCS
jgi:DNA uptake protein ComE-like DNA-binding protein